MWTPARRFGSIAAFASTLAFLPTGSYAQACTAQVSPGEIETGAKAVPVTVTVSQPIGALTGIDASRGSGISLAFPGDLPSTEIGPAGGPPRPIEMGEAENVWIVWLSLSEAGAGTHAIIFTAREGRCGAELKVEPAS